MQEKGAPRKVVVVGAGVVGLSTAWFLQERGVDVVVVDRDDVAAGASWGNAGYLSPAFTVPLPEPAVLRYGLRALLDRDAPLHVPATVDPGLWAFLLGFARRCTPGAWKRSMGAYAAINGESLDAFDILTDGGVEATMNEAPITAAFDDPKSLAALRHEFESMTEVGQQVTVREAAPSDVGVPQLSSRIESVLRIEGQRFIDPGAFVFALAQSVRERGGEIRSGFGVTALHQDAGVTVESAAGDRIAADAVVLATGAWLPRLAKPLGVRTRVQAGRGYSFTVPTDEPVPGPLYLPAARVACTPYRGGLRVAGTMEFRSPDAGLDDARVEAIVRSARPLLTGVAWEERKDDWVGSRPVSVDGLPLIGATRAPGVFVAGGHGMWGLTLGPWTGRMLGEQIVTGARPARLHPFDPLR